VRLEPGTAKTTAALTYTYDSNGNLTQKIEGSDTWTYEWDAENRLKRVLKNSVEQARFAYDPRGRRVEKVTGGVTTSYTYDAESILRETSSTGTTFKYVHGDDIDEPLAHEDGVGTLTYFHPDGLGSIVRTTNSTGGVTATRRYDAFGNLELGATNGHSFTGREWDSETGLYYYRARYYDPKIGRFISEDPIGLNGGINLYAYADNSPATFGDPFGLQASSPQVHHDDWDNVRRICGGRGHSSGCNKLSVDPSCTCKPNCDGTLSPNASVTISQWNIFVATNAPRSPTRILNHELKHAARHASNAAKGQRLADDLNQRKFKTQAECENACTLFGNRVQMFMTQGHFWMDFTWQVFGF
jgi:RHS repeat-associated protein